MKSTICLKIAALILISGIARQAFADEKADLAKVDSAADRAAACSQNKDMKHIQKLVIYYDGDQAALDAQLGAYSVNDVLRESNVLNCLSQIAQVIETENTNPTFASRLKEHLDHLLNVFNSIVQKNDNPRINNAPATATIGIRG